ncbi:uncharacterized protein LOC134813916 [Bolinopsis microptera]|uniref:uncharacterized protein LOC134813916 n=1 Tax=Bolinopsis microptera TaxID=2820187 RepID=UPI0030795707
MITESLEFSETGDVAVGCVVIVMCVVALLGNSLSVAYFWEQRRKTIYPLLYSFMSILDITSSLVSLPVIVTLFSSRDPVMFGNGAFCLIWTVLFYYLLRISIFLVLLISVTRTMGMTLPMYKTKQRTVLLSLAAYSAIILIVDTVYLSTGMLRMRYREKEAFCEMFEPEDLKKYTTTTSIYFIFIKLEIIVPSVLIIISFIVGTMALVRRIKCCKKMKKDESQFRDASVTVTLFTATYLVCYLPCLCLEVLYFVSLFWDTRTIRGTQQLQILRASDHSVPSPPPQLLTQPLSVSHKDAKV